MATYKHSIAHLPAKYIHIHIPHGFIARKVSPHIQAYQRHLINYQHYQFMNQSLNQTYLDQVLITQSYYTASPIPFHVILLVFQVVDSPIVPPLIIQTHYPKLIAFPR